MTKIPKVPKIALLVPSRERTDKKIDLSNSIANTVDDVNNIKLYFGVDDDDKTRDEVNKLIVQYPFINIVDIKSTGRFQNLGVLWNICAKASSEDIISMIGDDMVFMTKGWDTKIIEEFSFPNIPQDNLKMVYCYDGRHGKRIAVNAFIHRVYMDITGYFMREEFPVDKIDIWLQQIFKAFDRITYRGYIHIEHKHWSFGKSKFDDTTRRMRSNNAEAISTDLWNKTIGDRKLEAEKISKALGIPFNAEFISEKTVNG